MPAQNRHRLFGLFAAASLLALATFPLLAHQVDPTGASSPALATSAVMATGTVAEMIVDNQVSGVTLRYLALRIDEGQTVALTGAGLDLLSSGTRVTATGSLTGNLMTVTSVSILPAARVAGNAGPSAQSQRQVQGTLVVFHKDYFAEGRGEYGLGVYDGATQMTPLNMAVIPDALRPGMTVSVSGTTAVDGVSLDVSQITILGLPPVRTTGIAATPTTNNVLVMPIKFTNSPASDPFTPSQVDQVMRTNPGSVAAYYNEVSYGQQQLNITVACATAPLPTGCATNTAAGGWLLSSSAAPANCDFTTIGNLADQAATAAGYNIANYHNRFYVLPGLSCGWAGLAYIGYPYQAWSNAYNVLWVYGHELGHNFDLWHAGSLNCSPQVIGGGCSVDEYGDRFDIMGNNRNTNEQMHFNAMQKSALNWIPASSVRTHTSGTATYTLSPLESPGQTTYAVKIPVASDANRTYWIEYRQPIGFDSGIAAYPNNGAQIRVANPFDYPCSGCGGDDTELLDMTPGSGGGPFDAALVAGQSFVDSTYGIRVTVNSATSSALSVTVSIGGQTASTTGLTSSANPSVFSASVAFTATVIGSAPTGSVAFTADGTTLTGCGAVALPTGTASSKIATCSTSSLSVGTHSIVAAYTGDPANSGSTSPTLSQGVSATGSINVALAGNGATTLASSTYQGSNNFAVSGINDNERAGVNWGQGGGWNGANANGVDWAQITFNGSKTIDHVVVYTVQDNYQNPVEPTDTLTFSRYGLIDFTVQGWNGSSWVTLGSAVTGNNLVKRTVNFAPFTTTQIRISITRTADGYCRITEVEAWGTAAGGPGPTTTTLGSSANPSTLGASVTFTATVTGSAPTGNVGFTTDGTPISGCASVALPTGTASSKIATCSTSSLSAGTHSIVAAYTGDPANSGSTSPTLSQGVNATGSINVALASNGGVATLASSTYNSGNILAVSGINDNERAGTTGGRAVAGTAPTPTECPTGRRSPSTAPRPSITSSSIRCRTITRTRSSPPTP